MNAIKFMQEYKRLCDSYKRCAECPLYIDKPCSEMPARFTNEFSTKLIKFVEDWSASHPVVTRASIFKKIYPNASTSEDGAIVICPKCVDKAVHCLVGVSCWECQKKYWLKEVQQ